MSEHTDSPTPIARVVGKVVEITGFVRAINTVTHEIRMLELGSLIYSDEIIDTSKGKVVLAQDAEIVLSNDITSILTLDTLPADLREKFLAILKQIEEEEAAKAAKEEGETVLADEMHSELRGVSHISVNIDVLSNQQDSHNYGLGLFNVNFGKELPVNFGLPPISP